MIENLQAYKLRMQQELLEKERKEVEETNVPIIPFQATSATTITSPKVKGVIKLFGDDSSDEDDE